MIERLFNAIVARLLPSGGASGEVLKKSSASDYDVDWSADESGSGGLATVASDATLTGDGSAGDPLAVANPFSDADETKLDGIETGATADQTGAEMVTALEGLSSGSRLAGSAVRNIPTASIADAAITGPKIAALAVDGAKIASNAVGTGKVADDAITSAKLADDSRWARIRYRTERDGAVNADRLAANAVTTEKIAAQTIIGSRMGTASIGSRVIADGAVTAAKLADDAVTTAKVLNDAITQVKLADDAVGLDQLADAVMARLVSTGGTDGQVLTRSGASGFGWADVMAAAGLGGLTERQLWSSERVRGQATVSVAVPSDAVLLYIVVERATIQPGDPAAVRPASAFRDLQGRSTASSIHGRYLFSGTGIIIYKNLSGELAAFNTNSAGASYVRVYAYVSTGEDISTDTTLSGDGTGASPLAVANPFTAADETKLDGIETGATADQTGAEMVTALEGLSGNARLQASAIRNLPSGGGLSTVASDATLTGDGTAGNTLKVANPFTDADETKLDGIETGATADQTGAEIVYRPARADRHGAGWPVPQSGKSRRLPWSMRYPRGSFRPEALTGRC